MSNINWITTRREDVSQILVDSLQKLGKKSTVKGILAGNASLNRPEILLPPNNYANTIQSSDAPSTQATSPSNSSNSRRSCIPIVPKLDIDALTYQQCPLSRSKGASQLGNPHCNHSNHVCTTCGEVTTPTTYADSISVLSEDSQSEPEESKVYKYVPTDFIMNNVDLEYSSDRQVKPNINEFGRGSVISITCANPDELILQRNENIRKVMTDSQTMTDSDSEIISPPFAITRHNAIRIQDGMDSQTDSSTIDSIPEIVAEFHDTSQLSNSNQFTLQKRMPESPLASPRYPPASPRSPVASLPILLKNTPGGSLNDPSSARRVSLGFKLQPDPQAHGVIVTAPVVAKSTIKSRGNKLRNMFRFHKTDKDK